MDAIEDWDCQAPKWQKHAIKMACVTQSSEATRLNEE